MGVTTQGVSDVVGGTSRDVSTAAIEAHGLVTTRGAVIWFLGIIGILLVLGAF